MPKMQINITLNEQDSPFDAHMTQCAKDYFDKLIFAEPDRFPTSITKLSEITGIERNRMSRILYAMDLMGDGMVNR
jgi:hypothetical protein